MKSLIKIFYFFSWIYVVIKNVQSLNNVIVNDNNYMLSQEKHCMKQQYIYFLKDIYKLCHLLDDENASKLLIQKGKDNNKWELITELIYRDNRMSDLFFSFVNRGQLIVLMCYENFRLQKYECIHSASNDGVNFKENYTNFSSVPHKDHRLSNYSSLLFPFNKKKYLLICSLNSHSKVFVTCSGSSDGGITWDTIFRFSFSCNPSFNYYRLAPRISDDSIGFQFVKYKNDIWTNDYIECIHQKDYNFECKEINLQKENKVLQSVLKVNNNYISSYMGKEDFLCYLYYTSENVILIRTKINKDKEKGDCNPRDLLKVGKSKFMLIYAEGMDKDGLSVYHYANS